MGCNDRVRISTLLPDSWRLAKPVRQRILIPSYTGSNPVSPARISIFRRYAAGLRNQRKLTGYIHVRLVSDGPRFTFNVIYVSDIQRDNRFQL